MGFFDFIGSVFGRSPAESGGGIVVTGGTGTGRAGQFSTSLPKNDPTMMKQLQEARKYRDMIENVARMTQFPPAVICGIGSRESHWGLALKPPGPGGTGDHSERGPRGDRTGRKPPDGGGYGRGLMQIDYDWHEFARAGNWRDPRENLMYSAKVLNDARAFFQQRGVPDNIMMRAIIAAYNSGATNTHNCIQEGRDVDCNTTGRDYSKDVLNRAGWFQLNGWR
jgi:hypothetical protein